MTKHEKELIWDKINELETLTNNISFERIQDGFDFFDLIDEIKELTKPF